MSKKALIRILFIIYIIGLLTLTFIVRETMNFRGTDNREIILMPFRELLCLINEKNHFFWFMQIFLNILLFVPIGILLPVQFRPYRKFRITALTGFICSLGIEIMQYITGRGVTETDDVINNTLGAVIGFFCFKLIFKAMKKDDG